MRLEAITRQVALATVGRARLSRRALTVGFTLLAIALFAASAWYFRPATGGYTLLQATAFLLAGAVALGIATGLNRHSLRETQEAARVTVVETPAAARPARFAALWRAVPVTALVLGVVALLALVEINGPFLGIPALQTVPLRTQFILLCLGVALVVAGLGLTPCQIERAVGTRQIVSLRWRWYEIAAVVLVTLLALGLRVWRLEDLVHKFIDEIHFSTAVAGLLSGTGSSKLLSPFAGITAFPWLYPYWQAEIAAVHGRNLESLRLVSAALGTLTVPATYFLARTLFDRTTAVMAALLLATFPPHLHFSRIGLNNVADPLFGTLALAFLARGIKTGRRLDYALAGAMLGLTQYFYEGGRLLFPPLVVGWLVFLWILGRGEPAVRPYSPQGHTSVRRNLAALALAALLVGLPVYTTLLAERKPVMPRMETVAVGGSYYWRVVTQGTPQTLEQHLTRPFLVYVHQVETGLFYGGDQPLILEMLVPVFLLGVFGLLWRGRQMGIVVLLWVLLTSAGNMLMTESAIFARYVVAFPALALLLALGVRYTLPLLRPGWRGWPPVMVALAAVMAFAQMRYYFGHHLEVYNRQLRPGFDSEDPIFRAAHFPPGTHVHIISNSTLGQQYLSGIVGYLNSGLVLDVRTPLETSREYLASLIRGVDHAFFVEPTDAGTLTLLQEQFRLGVPHFSPFNVPRDRQLVLFYVRGSIAGR
ncbi:MAG: glycosyltransferase family 39 protein [Chloroflexi bacterium]|nr:glycosyltransferase family 39 protein [Chloroflexota bacterium]